MIGTTLGHYRIVEKIGEGGMGVVYRAHDERLDRDVAIKVLPREVAGDQDRLRRFDREAKAVAALSHPNILEIFDFDTEGDVVYAVTELLEGETLREQLQKSRGPLPWKRVQEIGAAVANGLGAAHGKGVVHRDIKPSNIFLCSDGRAKILDFGLASTHEVVGSEAETGSIEAPLTHQGTVMGTVGFMAPEQVRGEPADHRSDIFALGCVLYEMLTGHRAFKRDTTAEIMTAILREEPPSFAESGVHVAPDVAKAVQHCLEKNPERRFQSAADLAFALGSESEKIASPAVPSETSRPRQWLMPLFAIAGILFVALGMVFGPGILDRLSGQPEELPIRSIAILPLENLTGDPEQAYLVDGLHQELIATFAQISGFDKVIARTSVMGFRNSDTPIREIGKQLGVEAVIEGSVRRSGQTVRVTVQLIDARTESHLWAESYESDLIDILALQSEVARAVAGEVRITLTPDERDRLAVSRQVVEEAYEAFLWGSHLLALGPVQSEASLLKAIAFFETAIEADPDYAPAHARLSMALSWLGVRYRPPAEVMPKANRAALRASELDDTLVDAHVNLGRIKMYWEWDWDGAKSEISLARELSPSDPDAVREDAFLHVISGRLDEAVALQERVVQLDPLAPRAREELGRIYWFARRYDDGIRHLQETAELFPNRAAPHLFLCWIFQSKGQWAQALAAVEKSGELHPAPEDDPLHLATLVFSKGGAGKTEEATETLERLLGLRSRSYVSPIFLAYGYIGIGDMDRSIEWLERAYEARHQHVTVLEQLPSLDPLRDDPRFQDIVRRMNFPEN